MGIKTSLDFSVDEGKLIYKGKSKLVYQGEDETLYLYVTDNFTGDAQGNFNPGENQVVGQRAGLGNESLRLSLLFMEEIAKNGIKTHLLGYDLEKNLMHVQQLKPFGPRGVEWIYRSMAWGSILKQFPGYFKQGQRLTNFIETTDKNDSLGDPRISPDILIQSDQISEDEYDEMHGLTLEIAEILDEMFFKKDTMLIDFKIEFGKDDSDNIILFDEISASSLRAAWIDPKNATKSDGTMTTEEIAALFLR